ncbi:HlyD family secretion protein [Chitinophaga qingshengii]|uniref:HlyD family efflux transporter periplasmic adaptor subunit n=1 Tax=Chitinophaga qingshengii TaxID=1569794 RepID=A0ABR7TKW8_9BACT|nr:HlyD family efflux transporter periplasmic adaptor subunit [Chitinophaga qingshengii]MBC9930132.1 HlyD family efflux transporter periplasmic adaptor subunit [Chitinophaga qingshengii]
MDATKKNTTIVPEEPGIRLEEPVAIYTMDIRNTVISRSEAVDEIISRKTGFMERWALLFYAGVFLLMALLSWFIRFPDIIDADGVLTAVNAPKELLVNQEGRLVRLFIPNNTVVKKGSILGWIESTGDHTSILRLQRQADSAIMLLGMGLFPASISSFSGPYQQLGEIQRNYQDFLKAREQFRDYTGNGYYIRKQKILQDDITRMHQENEIVFRQKELAVQDMKMAESTFNMQSRLFDQKVLSEEDFRKAKSVYLNKEISISSYDHTILSNQSRLSDKQKEIDELTHEVQQQLSVYQQALGVFKYALDEWVKKYVISSPINGKVTYLLPMQENQHLQQGRQIGYIVPDAGAAYVEAQFRQGNFGKIDTGMKVRLQFEAYPFQEFGEVLGTVAYISNVPADSGFLGNIRLTDKLKTTRRYHIPYKSGLKIHAKIVTKDMRLLERFYYNIVKSMTMEK